MVQVSVSLAAVAGWSPGDGSRSSPGDGAGHAAPHRPHLGEANDPAPPDVAGPHFFHDRLRLGSRIVHQVDHGHPRGRRGVPRRRSVRFRVAATPSQPRLDEREAFHQAGELPLVDSGECLAAQSADLAMPPGGQPAAPPGQRPELLVQRFPQTQRCRLGHLLVGCPEGLGAAQERFIQAHERFNQRERGPLGRFLLAGLRR